MKQLSSEERKYRRSKARHLEDVNATSRTSMPFDYGEWKEPNRAILLSRFEAWLNTIRKEDVRS